MVYRIMSPRYLVVGLEFGTLFLAFHILGMSSSQLTDLYFSERLKPQAIIINQLIISNGCYLDHPPSHWLATKVENPVVFWDILINSSKEGMVFHAATGSISELYWVKPHIYKLKDVQKLIIP